jgi:glucose-6-phosphate isomerase
MPKAKAQPRMLFDLEPVIFDKEWFSKQQKNYPVYWMHRKVLMKNDIRYDITKLEGKPLGKEFNKTFGHYHPNNYPEIYEVLKGKAIFLLQKPLRINSRKILDVVAIYAKKGEQVIIPPRYGHVTINPSRRQLVIANLVSDKFKSIYEPFKRLRGACYYLTKKGWIKNENWVSPPLKKMKAKKVFSCSLEKLIQDFPEKLEFLNKPSVIKESPALKNLNL